MIKKNRIFRITIGIVLMTLSISSGANAATHTVCISGCDFNSIQGAIDDVNTVNGDTIEVQTGNYYGTIVINKQLNLIGIEKDGVKPRIIGTDTDIQSAVKIETDGVDFQGFTINNDNGNIFYGIDIESGNNNIRNNEISGFNGGRGILIYSPYNTIRNNVIRDNSIGILISSPNSNNNELADNLIINNNDGISLSGSSSTVLRNNKITNNDNYGIDLENSGTNEMIGNEIHSNYDGIYFYGSSENIVKDNIIWGNSRSGIELMFTNEYINSYNNNIYNNYFHNSENAIEMYSGEFPGNIWNIDPLEGTNIVGGAWLGGNFWSNYEGEDSNGDGLGDTSFRDIEMQSVDYHPLIPAPGFLKVHNIETQENFLHIQEAIEDPLTLDSHTIEVDPGTYKEHVSVIKSLKLLGKGTANTDTIIDGGNIGTVINIRTEGSTIENFKIIGSGNNENVPYFDAAIGINNDIYNVNIKNNLITLNEWGFTCWSCGVNIEGNEFTNNANDAIFGGGTTFTIIGNEIIGNNGNGIHNFPAEGTLIRGNTIADNKANGIYLSFGSENGYVTAPIIELNNIYGNGKGGQNWIDLENGIILEASSGNIIKNNYLNDNSNAGILLKGSINNEIFTNVITGNSNVGIQLHSSLLSEGLVPSASNTIYDNYFDNTKNVDSKNVELEDSSVSNQWNIEPTSGQNIVGGYKIGGNFWSDLSPCENTNDENFCVSTYGSYPNMDNYPLNFFDMPIAPVPELNTVVLVLTGIVGLVIVSKKYRDI